MFDDDTKYHISCNLEPWAFSKIFYAVAQCCTCNWALRCAAEDGVRETGCARIKKFRTTQDKDSLDGPECLLKTRLCCPGTFRCIVAFELYKLVVNTKKQKWCCPLTDK
jgi:hypothetical protein